MARNAWPGAFEPGALGLTEVAHAIANALLSHRADPSPWLGRLADVLSRLGLEASTPAGFGPDGLAAHVLAATVRNDDPNFIPWPLRQLVFNDDVAWRALAADIRQDLDAAISDRLQTLETWDRSLAKGLRTARFFELWLNACDTETLAATVVARADDLRTLGPLAWWRYAEHPDAGSDLRDAYARLAPMAPVAVGALPSVRSWTQSLSRGERGSSFDGLKGAAPEQRLSSHSRAGAEGDFHPWASSVGDVSTRLSVFSDSGQSTQAAWQVLANWRKTVPIGKLDLTDRYRFLAWIIHWLDEHDSVQVARFAKWLVDSGITDVDPLNRWTEILHGHIVASDAVQAGSGRVWWMIFASR